LLIAVPATQPEILANGFSTARTRTNVLNEKWLGKQRLRAQAVPTAAPGIDPNLSAKVTRDVTHRGVPLSRGP